jgi:hypothetical protein
MKSFLRSRDGASKGAALLIVLALVVLSTGLALAYFTRTASDRQLAQSSHNDTSAELLARSALDIVVGDFKQEIITNQPITRSNIQPSPYPIFGPTVIPNLIRYSSRNAAASRASNVSSADASANGRSITANRWNSHYLVPLLEPSATPANSKPIAAFTPPDWVLVTKDGPTPLPSPDVVIGRYAFAVYDEGGLLDMSLAGYPSWPNSCSPAPPAGTPSPTPWLMNVGRKGIVALADLTALPFAGPNPQNQIDKIVGWRNYAMTRQPGSFFPSGNPSFPADCTRQDFYGSYLLYFGDPPFTVESLLDKLSASIYPFSSVPNTVYPAPTPGASPPRTDQSLVTRQQLLKLRSTLGFSQNVLQYMGTFSRERNWPAPDWPNLQGTLSEGRFNMNNLALVVPNPGDCTVPSGKKKGWQTGKNRNHLCGTPNEVIELFGLFWVKAEAIDTNLKTPGHWRYIEHTGPNPPGDPDPNPHSIICFRGANQQEDFFQVLHYALNVARPEGGRRCAGPDRLPRTFGIGASLIDQYDSGDACSQTDTTGCDLDLRVASKYRTHTTAIEYGQGSSDRKTAYGMELDYSVDNTNGDWPCGVSGQGNNPQRPSPAPRPITSPGPNPTIVLNHAFSNVGEFGYGIDTSALATPGPSPSPACAPSPLPGATAQPTLDFSSPNFYDAPILDFFSYNPISSAYPRAGIVNLYTRNAPVLAAMLKGTLVKDPGPTPTPGASPTPVVSAVDANAAATAIVAETQRVLGGNPTYGSVQQTDLTRAIAARLAKAAVDAVPGVFGTSDETKNTATRALAEMGQTRTWNLMIDVIAQTGRYSADATSITQANKFIVEGEKRYWLHISLGRDLVKVDPGNGTVPCQLGDTGCQVDVLGTQLEEVSD